MPKKTKTRKEQIDNIDLSLDREPVHPFKVSVYSSESENGPLTADIAKELLRWKTETETLQDAMDNDPDDDHSRYRYDNPLLVDEYNEPIMCYNNLKNRLFREPGARRYAQDILNRKWAGPLNKTYFMQNTTGVDTTDEITINGESIIIGRYGSVLSGQHRLVGLILAKQMWEKNKDKYTWETEPVLETIVVFGVSENPKVLQTLDNCIPRSLADTVFTSGIYKDRKPADKKELSKMLAYAIDLLWSRVGINNSKLNSKKVYKTNSEENEFLERHPKLLECVEHIFYCDTDRAISRYLKLKSGDCAALLYLMAAGATDGDNYRHADIWSEENIDFQLWDRACEFWKFVSDNIEKGRVPLMDALGELVEVGDGTVRNSEKYIIIARAWNLFLEDEELTKESIRLTEDDYMQVDTRRVIKEESWTDFGGIDYGDPAITSSITVETVEEVQIEKPVKKEKINKDSKERKNSDKSNDFDKELSALQERYPGKLLLFSRGKSYAVFDMDATICEKVLRVKISERLGYPSCSIKESSLKNALEKLAIAGYSCEIITDQ